MQSSEMNEVWIEERVIEYQGLSVSDRIVSPEEFASRATDNETLRGRLLARLHSLRRLEDHFALLREEPIRSGSELADFEILEQLGAGGMGRVYRARQKSVARLVAIKVPHRAAALEPAERQRFLREADSVAQLRHPSIVPLLFVGEHQGAPFLVFELSEGRSLRAILGDLHQGRLLRSGAALARPDDTYEQAVIEVLLSMLDALHAAHEGGIVHRDVKPGNVLVERDGRVRVVDFGMARRAGQDTLTESRELVGTVGYLAPEVVRKPHACGPWSDVWSAGVVLYELLTLRRPFEGETVLQILWRVENEEVAPLHPSHGVARPLSAIVEKALSREIGARYASAQEFAADLRACRDGGEVLARPSTVVTRLGRRLNRHPAVTAVSVALAVALALLAAVWRGRAEVQAQLRRSTAETVTREALLWWYADGEPLGRAATQSAGRDHAIEGLESALAETPGLIEARVGLAQYAAMGNRKQRALELIDALEAQGVRLRCLAWARALASDAGRGLGGLHPEPFEALDLARVEDLDRLAWARHCLNSNQSEQAMEVLRPIEAHEILGPTACYLQFEACHTRRRRDATRAIGYLHSALSIAPDHPILLANLAFVQDERRRELSAKAEPASPEQQALDSLGRDIEALLPRLAAAEQRFPWLSALWLNHSVLLAKGKRIEEAAEVAQKGLEALPGNAVLTNQFAQTRFDRWALLLSKAEPLPQSELEDLRGRLELATESDPRRPENLYNLTYVQYLLEDEQATLLWGERARKEYLDQVPPNPTIEAQRRDLQQMLDWATGG